MGRPTHFLLFYIIFGWTTLWLDSLIFSLHALRKIFTILFPKIVDFGSQNHYAGPLLPNGPPTQSTWLVPSHLASVAIFVQRSSNNFCASLTLVTKSSTSCFTCYTWATDISISDSVACIGSDAACMCANVPSMVEETANVSSNQGWIHSLSTTSFYQAASTYALRSWASLILASRCVMVIVCTVPRTWSYAYCKSCASAST